MIPNDVTPDHESAAAAAVGLAHRAPLDRMEEIYFGVAGSASLRDSTYWLEILFASGIATLGLVLNSPAVIIGAMLISPLMGPIMAAGLGVAAQDFVLVLRSITSIAISCLGAIAFSTTLVVLLPFREMTSEIAARTSPNTLDLFVALFSGAVGAIAIVKQVRGVATSIPGVAIAVALMPPLCVVGYGLGLLVTIDRVQGESVMRGGGLLFLTNLVAITFASMLVFLFVKIDDPAMRQHILEWRKSDPEQRFFARIVGTVPMPERMAAVGSRPGRILMGAVLLVLVAVPLTRSFNTMKSEIAQRQRENTVQKLASQIWQRDFANGPDGKLRAYVDQLTTRASGKTVSLDLRVFTSAPFTAEERASFTRKLAAELQVPQQNVALSLTEIPTSQYEVATRRAVEPAVVPKAPSIGEAARDLAARVTAAAMTATLPPGASFRSATMAVGNQGSVLTYTYVSVADLSADAQAMIATDMRKALSEPALTVNFAREEPPAAELSTEQRSTDGVATSTQLP